MANGKRGMICKSCLRKYFPEGKYYKVAYKRAGEVVHYEGGYAYTKSSAEEIAKRLTEKMGRECWVEEVNYETNDRRKRG